MVAWNDLIERMEAEAAVDVVALSGGELCAGVLGARRLRELADLVEVHCLGELEAREYTDAEFGMPTASWFAASASLPVGVGRRQVALADRLRRHFDGVDAAWQEGRVNGEHVRALHDAANPRNVERMAKVQDELIGRVDGRTFRQWHRDVQEAASLFDEDGAFDPSEALARNRATFGRTGELGSLRATFTDEYAEPVEHAIDARADELFHRFTADHQVDPAIAVPARATLRALALAELVRGGLAVDIDSTRPPRTEAIVLLRPDAPAPGASDPADITGVGSWTATNPDGRSLSLRRLDALLCDVAVRALVLDGDGNPLNLGRSRRLASPAQRRALIVRDGGCAFPGCDAPPSWCDAHHVDPYDDGGPTDIDNLVLLCRRHHGVAHRHEWAIHIGPDQWCWWRSPSGTTFWSQRHGQTRAGPAPPGDPTATRAPAPPEPSPDEPRVTGRWRTGWSPSAYREVQYHHHTSGGTMKMRTRNLAALAIVGSGLLAACSNGAGNDVRAEAAGTAAPSTTAAPASSTTTASAATGSSVVAVGHTALGDVLVNAQGRTLYGFTDDVNGVSSCTGGCATSWPPVIVAADFTPDASLAAAKLHTVKRDDGTFQLAAGKWPLYTFAGDSAAGDVTGQGSLGKWFVVQPDGALHKTAVAAPAGATAAPASPPTTRPPAAPTTKAPAPMGY